MIKAYADKHTFGNRAQLAHFLRPLLKLILTFTLALPTGGLFLVSTAAFSGRFFWFFDLWSHFRWQYFLIACGLLLLAIVSRRPKIALLALLTVAANGLPLVPYTIPALEASSSDATTVRLMMANTLYGNMWPEYLLSAIEESDADVVVLVEMNRLNQITMAAAMAQYEFMQLDPQNQVVILSRYPLENGRFIDNGPGHRPQGYAEITVAGTTIGILGIHPPTPMNAERWERRNSELQQIAEFVQASDVPMIVTGDMNISSFSPNFAAFLTAGGLVDGRVGQGLNRSWPTFMPLAKIPIDHFVSSPEINVIDFTTGPHTGSDHLPIVVDFIVEGQ